MKFWDSSALVPLLIQEADTKVMRSLLDEDRQVVVWATTAVEITSALWRRHRAGEIGDAACATALDGLGVLERSWSVIVDLAQVATRARRILAGHPLRAADACQLAAALVACRDRTADLAFVTLDDRLAGTAGKEGLRVQPSAR